MNFIIYAYRYDDDSGGGLVLHKLCHLLNQLGFDAKLWINYKPIKGSRNYLLKLLKYYRKNLHKRFSTNPKWNTPIANSSDLKDDTVVIYAEIVDGNPLNAKNIVRWLLHKPGFHDDSIVFSKSELYFFYLKSYITNASLCSLENELFIPNNREDTYYQYNFEDRKGSCYILRKGKNREITHNLEDSILIDGKSHDEIAKIFNEVEYCISYDTYTMYSVYAAMCGCKSVVVPEDGISKSQWQPDEKQSYGLAYGFDDLEWVERTRNLLLETIALSHEKTNQQVLNFVKKCKDNFKL